MMATPDAHTHLSCARHMDERELLLPACICSSCPSEWEELARIAQKHTGKIIPSFGIHPWHVDESSLQSIETLSSFLQQFPHAGIGEIGLDHTRNAAAPLDLQQEIFECQLNLACQTGRAVSIHCVKAWGRLLDSLEKFHPSRILIHGWKGPSEILPRLHALNCRFSIGLSSMDEQNILSIPANRLLVESDEQCGSASQAANQLLLRRKDLNPAILQKNFEELWML